jgi:hypothetical protein
VVSTYHDWAAPYIRTRAAGRETGSLGQVLLYEAQAHELPRHWLRWAVYFAQLHAKVDESSSRDQQLACNLPDADLLLTRDRRFRRILVEITRAVPVPMAEPLLLVKGGDGQGAVDAVEAALADAT